MEGTIKEIAREYNKILTLFVGEHNRSHPVGNDLHIHDLSTTDLQALQRDSYGVQVVPVPMAGGLRQIQEEDPYPYIKEQALEILGGKAEDFTYILLDKAIGTNDELSKVVCDSQAQIGMCVVRRRTDANEFEMHRYGNEGIIPRLFNSITLITKGYDTKKRAIDRGTARLVYMPVDENRIYTFDPNTGHYFPHVIGLTEVLLPDGTGDESLEAAEIRVNNSSRIYVARNILLASSRGLCGTKAEVIGETRTTEILQTLQEKVDKKIGKDLENLAA